MASHSHPVRGLDRAHIDKFITDGFVRIDSAFPRALADEARAILWKDTGCNPDDPATSVSDSITLTSSSGARTCVHVDDGC